MNNGRIDGCSNNNNLGNQSRQTIRKPQFKRELKNNEITLGRKVDRLMNSRNRIGGTEIDTSELFNYDENTMKFEEELYRFKSINNDTITCHIEDDNDNEIQDYSNESVENVNLEKDLKKKKMQLSIIEIDINIQKAQKQKVQNEIELQELEIKRLQNQLKLRQLEKVTKGPSCKGNNDFTESPTTLMINENHKKRPLNVESHSTSVEISDESIEVIDKCQNELEHQLRKKKDSK